MSSNGNIDIELLAGLDINSSEQEIRNAIKVIQNRIRSGDSTSIQIDAKLDDRLINNTLNKLQSILKTKEISIDTRNSIIQLQKEANAMMGVVTSANKAAKEKLEFTNANKKVEKSANDTADAIRRERDAMCSLDDIDEILERINAQGRRGGNVFQQFGTTLRNAFAVYSAANLLQDALYDIIDAGKESIETVKELNDAATALRMATGGSFDSVKQLVQDYNTLGQELGAITTEVSDSADAWLRQGHSVADTNELIKDSMMLSKITSLNSADSTKYLTSAMQGYKVAVEDVVNVVSKLSAVDLESATDAAGLAEAMSRTAESARMAGVSMDRLLGMIATVGEVTQKSMSSIGESYKTIFSRMRDIKDGKLSVVGDDGEVENISNVETVLNQLGIKLRESNSEFRNFQEVLDDVADSWDSYSSVQQAAIAKAFSGVRQQENFAVMMGHYAKVREYTDISANSEGVAEEKFGYYLESLEAKTNALKASLENLAAVTIDDELYGSVLDVTKSLVDATAASGLLKGALAGLATAGSIYAFQHLAGYVGDATQSFSNLSEAMNMVGSNTAASINLNRLVDLTQGLSQSQTRLVLSTTNLNDAQKIAVLRAQGLSRAEALLQLQTWGVTSAQQGATAATITFGSAMRGLYMTLAANPLFVVATAVTLGVTLWNKYKESVEDAAQTAEKAREHYQSLADELSTLNEELKTTKDRMAELEAIGTDSLSLVEQEEYDKLCKTNEELERELRIKEALAKVAARESAEASENALTDESYTSNTQTNRDGSSKKVDNITYVEELVDRATRQKELLEEAKAELLSFENNWTGDDISMVQSDEWQYLNDVVANAEKAIGETESAISEAYETLDEDASGLVDAFGNVVEGFEDTYNRAENVKDKVDKYFTEEPETTTKESLEQQFGKVRVSSLSDEDIDIAVNLKNIGDMTFDELKEEIKNAKKEAKEPINIKVNTSDYLSNLESLSDGFEQISAIYKDVQDMGEFDFSALAKDSDFSKTFQGAGQAYQDFIDVVANSPSDINKCQSAFDDLVSTWFYGQTPLKDITDETYDLTVAWLKQKGVANAVEVADNALIESKKRLFIETHTLKEGTKEEIQALFDEASAAGFSENAMYSLAVAIATADDSQLTFEQQINAIYDIASAAGLASEALNSLITAAPADASSIDLGSWSEAAKNGTLNEWRKAQQTKQKLNGVKTAFNNWLSQNKMEYKPSVNYVGGGSGSGSSGSSGSASDPHIAEVDAYKNLTDAVSEYDRKLEKLERTYDNTDSVQERIGLKKAEIKLYQEQKDAIDALNKARDAEISDLVNKLRGQGFKIDYDPTTDNLLIHNREHINDINQSIIEQYEEYLERVDELNDANKDSADQWDELTSSIVKAGKELKDLEQEKFEDYIEGAEHLLRLMKNRKDAFGKESSVYTDMMNATLKRWKDLATTDYQGNIDQIRELEEQWMDFYDARIEKEKEILEMQLDDNDRVLDGVIKVIDDQIKALDDQIDGLSKANDERKKALELQKAQAELDKARNQKTRHVLRRGVGWVWEADDDAIKEAEENLSDLEYESKTDALEKEKEALEDLKEKWEEIPDIAEDEQNRLLMIEKLGADAEADILDDRIDVYEDFKDDYIDIQEQIQDKTDELEEHTSAAYLNVVKAFENMAKLAGIGLDTGATTQKTQSSWYVNKDGKAPSQAKVGDLVYTKGGTYEITSKDENGKFTSKKIDNVSTPITEDQWGTKISERVIESGEDVVNSVEDIIRVNEDLVDKTKKQILTDANLQKYIDENSKYTSEEIVALLDNSDVTDMLADYTDDNSDATDDNTDAIYDWIDALNNFELNTVQQQILVDEELSNALAKFDDSTMSPEDQAYLKEIQKAWNTAKAQGNQELMDELHALADSIREQYINGTLRPLVNGLDYNRIGADGYSKNFTENSRSDAYGGAPVTGIVGSTTSIWGLDSTDPDEVQKAIERGWITEEESKNLVQLSGGRYNSDGSKKVTTNTGKDLSDTSKWKSEEIRSNTTDSGNGTWTTTRYTNVETGETITKTDYEKNRKATTDNTSSLNDNTDSNNYSGDSNYDAADSIHSDVESNNKSMSTLGSKIDNLSNTVEKADLSGSNSSFGGSSKGSSGNKGGGSDSGYKMDNDPKSPTFGVRVKKAKGGLDLAGGMYNVNEKGDEAIVEPDEGNWIRLHSGSSVIPHEASKNMWEFGENPKMFLSDVLGYDSMKMNQQIVYTGGGEKVIHYNIGSINPTLPNVTKPDEFWDEFTRNLPNEAKQWASMR